MTLWLVFALMTAAAVFVVLWPLGRAGAAAQSGSDIAVYQDQMSEIERDRGAELIGEAEAAAARLEVSRRLLAAADADVERAGEVTSAPWRRRATALVALVLLPAGASALYLALGSPGLPAQPLEARRSAPDSQSIETLVARVEDHLTQKPDDSRGWQVVATVYGKLGRFSDAVKARRNLLRLMGANAERQADLGEALVAEANGVVTSEARTAFDTALRLEPNYPRALYFSGLSAEQDGRREAAAAIWQDLISRKTADADLADLAREGLSRVDPKAAAAATNTPAPASAASTPGPTAQDVAAAGQMSPEERTAMVRGMVERLAQKLDHDGSDVDSWLRLLRAYSVLGDRDKARAAAANARRALGSDPDKLLRLDELVKGLGLDG
jgi:cytochrome c-type biogenesis protein CcmH